MPGRDPQEAVRVEVGATGQGLLDERLDIKHVADLLLRTGPYRISIAELEKNPDGLDLGNLVPRLAKVLNQPIALLPDEMRADFAGWAKLWPFRDNGPSLHPLAAIMTLNDVRTLRMRIAQMSASTMDLARFLVEHPKVAKVHSKSLICPTLSACRRLANWARVSSRASGR